MNTEDDTHTIEPLSAVLDYVIIRPTPEHEQTTSGLVMPGVADRRTWTGFVLAVGPGRRSKKGVLVPPNTEANTLVAYDLRSIRDIKVGEEWLHVVRDEAVFFEYDEEMGKRLVMGKPLVDHEV